VSGKKQRLELTWIGKDERPKLEPRILITDPDRSYARHRAEGDIFDNSLIFGDNLLALKSIQGDLAQKVRCIFIDPPYNTGSAFSYYDDGVEHSLWLSLMRDRLELLWNLLRPIDGSLWISIDDREMPYLRVLLDEVCGRQNFIASNVWQKRYSRENRDAIGDVHEYIVVYATSPDGFKQSRNRIPLEEKSRNVYKNPTNDPRGPWRGIPMTAQGYRPNQMYEIVAPGGKRHVPPEGRCWSTIEPRFLEMLADGRVYFGKDGNSQPSIIRYLSEVPGHVPWTWWPHDEVGHTDEAKKESMVLFGPSAFPTPKPERLLSRIIEIATSPGDIVLDSFAGSGTTGAVAHKMGRRWVMIELGEHCQTHIIPRMKKIIDGADAGGVTETVGWEGGGGFRYYHLAPSLLEKDRWGNWVIARSYNGPMLAEAMCKHMAFTYAPSQDPAEYWRHGHSSERDFIFVTTANVTHDQLRAISEDVGSERTLLVCCKAFNARADAFENLTVKKIPQAVLSRCEWGRDDYSLRIAEAPPSPEDTPPPAAPKAIPPKRGRRAAPASTEPSLFSAMDAKGVGK
jgi:adenine-specific DNA-methyltransferase